MTTEHRNTAVMMFTNLMNKNNPKTVQEIRDVIKKIGINSSNVQKMLMEHHICERPTLSHQVVHED